MARFITTPGPEKVEGRRKVFLATPCYDKPAPEYTGALFESVSALAAAGIDAALVLYVGHAHVDDSRNRLVRDFLESDCDDLVFLDADNGWRAEDLVRLCGHPRDVVGGTYPLKKDEEDYPVRLLQAPGAAVGCYADGLVEVESLPTGFLRITRRVLEAMDAMAPHYEDKGHKAGQRMVPVIFERIMHGRRVGGDYAFCMKWRQMNGRVFLDPDCVFSHTGEKVWRGNWRDWFERNNGDALGRALADIGRKVETADTFDTLWRVWGNQWSVRVDEMAVLVGAVRGTAGLCDAEGASLPILEIGSGITTLIMVAACEEPRQVWALEHDANWLARLTAEARKWEAVDLKACYAPLEVPAGAAGGGSGGSGAWYKLPPELPEQFSMIFVDGPPRDARNDRAGILHGLDLSTALAPGGVLVMDDADESTLALLEGIEALVGARFEVMGVMGRSYGVLKRPQRPKGNGTANSAGGCANTASTTI